MQNRIRALWKSKKITQEDSPFGYIYLKGYFTAQRIRNLKKFFTLTTYLLITTSHQKCIYNMYGKIYSEAWKG